MNGLWITWETQRRNQELAQAFEVSYQRLDYSSETSLLRYQRSGRQTLRLLKEKTPEIVFAQCPSVVLCALLGLVRLWRTFHFVIDVHNVTLEQLQHSSFFLRRLLRLVLGRADLVIVSNAALVSVLEEYDIKAVALPDKLPTISAAALPTRFTSYAGPHIVLIASYASDEPLVEFLSAFVDGSFPGTLFVTGRRSRAGQTLRYESERVVFTDFLSEHDYEGLIASADLLVDLTTRENCLVCGAYEAIACGVPVLLSDTEANREVFPQGTGFASNSKQSYQLALSELLGDIERYQEEMALMQKAFVPYWAERFDAVKQRLKTLD